jgi:RNA polymerase sigma-70 factor (ECF subfamily)
MPRELILRLERGGAIDGRHDEGKARVMLSFQELFETYAPDVYRFAHALTGDSDEAKDITSETFMRAWAKNSTIRTETLKAYLLTVARNIYLESRRKDKHRVALEESIPDPAPGPDRRAEQRIELGEVQDLLRVLPEIDRTAFVMRVQQGMVYEEIARALGISLAAAKVKVHRVRMKLLNHRLKSEEPQWKSQETSFGTCSPSTPPTK